MEEQERERNHVFDIAQKILPFFAVRLHDNGSEGPWFSWVWMPKLKPGYVRPSFLSAWTRVWAFQMAPEQTLELIEICSESPR